MEPLLDRRKQTCDLRQKSVLNMLLQKHESDKTLTTMDISCSAGTIIGDIGNPQNFAAMYANRVLEKLNMNDERFDRLELDLQMLHGCGYSNLLRSMGSNTILKRIIVTEEFLEAQDKEEKMRMFFEIVGRLPQLQDLTINFPNRIHGSAASLLCSAVQYAQNLQSIVVSGLRLVEEGEEDELADAFSQLNELKTLRLRDLVVYNIVDVAPFLESVAELPELVDLEIRMKHKKSGNIKGMFFESLCESKSLHSLVLWNMELDMVQVTHVCEALKKSTVMKRFELWRCDLGPTFGILLTEVINKNRSLETIVISHVSFYGSGVVGLTNSLKRNSNIKELRLLNVCTDRKNEVDKVTKSTVTMMMKNSSIETLTFSSDELSEEDCINLDKQFHEHTLLRKRREEMLAKRSKWRTRFEIVFGITSKY